jgi:hypothetical protein
MPKLGAGVWGSYDDHEYVVRAGRTSGKLVLAIDHLWNEYSRRLERPAHEAPQYLGRSGR